MAADSTTAPARTVLIHGSCVTRDAFALPGETRFRLVDYYSRSSLASAFATRGVTAIDTSPIRSAFQRRMVERDIHKEFADRLREIEADVIVLDLVDERYDLFVDQDGGVVTRSAELLQSEGVAGDLLRVPSGSVEFLMAWEAGMRRFVDAARAAGVLDRVIVHQARWAERCSDGSSFEFQAVAEANHLLEYMDGRLRRSFAPEQFLRVPVELLVGDPDHHWGRSPVHYTPDYYAAFLDLLADRLGAGRPVAAEG